MNLMQFLLKFQQDQDGKRELDKFILSYVISKDSKIAKKTMKMNRTSISDNQTIL